MSSPNALPQGVRKALFVLMTVKLCLFGGLAIAQEMPDAESQEIMIKSTLSAWVDGLVTGDYSVMRALASEEFQEQISEDQLREYFREFAPEGDDIRYILLLDPVASSETGIGEDGQLVLAGYFETRPSRLSYKLTYVPRTEGWELLGISVDAAPPGEGE